MGIRSAQTLPKNALVFELDWGVLGVVWGSVVLVVGARGGGEDSDGALFERKGELALEEGEDPNKRDRCVRS